MSRAMFPGSTQAIPLTNVERIQAEQNTGPPRVGVNYNIDGPDDEPGAEMAKEARVWRTYVRETDRWDKEMIEGRNSALDVLLIFAALFSTISTAFIIESLGDLKPDPADSSAQTLLVISQTLTAIVNGQPVSVPTHDGSGTAKFSPSRSAVAVNVLWMLSLSLSVAVSLFAMLAKDWCYKFMSGRSGQIYEQARRRQEKWNGLKWWKMQEVLEYLPGAMHLSLLFFAVGLCVYLWDVNISVATPVIMITAIGSLVYAFTTVLPMVDCFCPYSTPATAPITPLARVTVTTLKAARSMVFSGIHSLRRKINYPQWLELAPKQTRGRLESRDDNADPGRLTTEDSKVPMDAVTSQMLAWLITNCEDSRSVDTALQAIAGAYEGLPHAPLAESRALELAVSRLHSCAKPAPTSGGLATGVPYSQLSVALGYSRTCVTLMFGGYYRLRGNMWNYYPGTTAEPIDYQRARAVILEYARLLQLVEQPNDSGMPALAAVAAARVMPLHDECHILPTLVLFDKALNMVIFILDHHFREGGTTLTGSMLYRLVESSAHYLVGRWPREEHRDSQNLLPILVVRAFVTSYNSRLDVARAAAVTLVAATFASDTYYPGGDKPTPNVEDRKKRALKVLRYYQTYQPDRDAVLRLFIFSFFGLLPQLVLNGHDTQLVAIAPLVHDLMKSNNWSSGSVWTIPESFSLKQHVVELGSMDLYSAAADTSDTSTLVSYCLQSYIRAINNADPRIYIITLIALCRAESKEHQKLCVDITNEQRVRDAPLGQLRSDDDKDLLAQLCRTLLNTHTSIAPIATLHFGLIIASIILSDGSLADHQFTLRPLLGFRDRFSGLKEPSPLKQRDVISHLERSAANGYAKNCLERIMQFVVDFCDAGLSPDPTVDMLGPPSESDWYFSRRGLRNLKNNYRPNPEELGLAGAAIEESELAF